MEKTTKEHISDTSQFLIDQLKKPLYEIHSFDIDCSLLGEKFKKEDIRDSDEFEAIFKDLGYKGKDGKDIYNDKEKFCCVYYFELSPEVDVNAEIIIKEITKLKNEKIVPAIHQNNKYSDSKIWFKIS